MYSDHTILQTVGQLLIAFLFLATGIINAGTKFKQHLDRMVAVGLPFARAALIAGFAMQLIGGALVAHLEGSYPNVVGLPLAETLCLLRNARVPTALDRQTG